MALPTEKTYTVDEFEDFIARPENRDRHFELIDGAIVEKAMPTEEHSLITGLFIYFLSVYARERGLGLPGPESRFRVPGNLRNTRQPDASMIIDPDVPITIKGAAPRAPDVIVEVRSPDENYDDLREKARWYVSNGVRLVWLVFPRPKIVEVYRPDTPSEILTVEDTIEGYDVLPGFTLPVANLFITRRSG
ncbi:MAG: Uma2 family endonuclease [Chloroflexi bacterium]|nr:Uma2 family endonuclease [Chloroflexota bacterium]MDL1884119.1 Uma2 family endonuclease [Anaerolineae bacterium CFX8]